MAAYYPRSAWGGREPNAGGIGQVSTVVIHHTASQGAPGHFDPQRWRNLENGEVNRGYSSLAYHFGIVNGPEPIIVESRGWGNRGAATGGNNPNGGSWNDTSVAIVLDAYFHEPYNDVPTPQALDAAADCIINGIFLGFINREFRCIPHSEASQGTRWATACPGDSLRGLVGNNFAGIEAIVRYKLDNAHAVAPNITPQQTPPAKPRCIETCSKRVLKQGSSGVCVTTMQNFLRAKGFNPGSSDGQFGKQTKDTLVCFQVSAGIGADGVCGPATWQALGA